MRENDSFFFVTKKNEGYLIVQISIDVKLTNPKLSGLKQ